MTKIMISGQEAIREEIKKRIAHMVDQKERNQKSFKLSGTEADKKLSE